MPFHLINPGHHQVLLELVCRLPDLETSALCTELAALVTRVHQDIPDKRRVSTGRYSIVKALGKQLYPLLLENGVSPPDIAASILDHPESEGFVQAMALRLLSEDALNKGELAVAQGYFETAASSPNWILRECASGLIRPLIKAFPNQVQSWYLELVRSPDPKLRRFVSESLRPVVENRWYHKKPEYALGILEHLFQEESPYPRTSLGNNLSDWMRVDQETAWPLVERLAASGDKNSYWIAYRACRNQVKKQPLRVLDTLQVDEYRYKDRIHRRADLPSESLSDS